MTQVDFYVLPDDPRRTLGAFTVKLAEQLYRKNFRMHISTPNPALTASLDDALWAASDLSFVPHEPALSASELTPITIGEGDVSFMDDVLMNLNPDVPPFFSRYQRVVEVISGDPEQRAQGRQRYKFYRDRGYELNLHNIP